MSLTVGLGKDPSINTTNVYVLTALFFNSFEFFKEKLLGGLSGEIHPVRLGRILNYRNSPSKMRGGVMKDGI
ncbi:MAG: hypothetical protein SynsKO_42750 [Synoicihabitans sp.]